MKFAFFTPNTLKIFNSFAEQIIPEGNKDLPKAWHNQTTNIVDDILRKKDERLRKKINLFLWLIQMGSFFFCLMPFTKLGAKDKTRWMRSLELSKFKKIRQGFWGLKTLVLMAYFTQEKVHKTIGFHGSLIEKEGYRRDATADSKPIQL